MDRMCYSDGLSTQEASDITLAYAKSIDTDRTYLMDKVNTHGNTIIKRWKKKSRDKRSATLLAAFPNIFPEKWNAAVVNYDYANVTWRKVLEYREALLAPWLNLPELRDDPLKLLALVHFRTQFAPEAWVAFDKVRSRSTWGLGGFRTEYAETCVILHGPKYGKVSEARSYRSWILFLIMNTLAKADRVYDSIEEILLTSKSSLRQLDGTLH